MKKIFKTTLAFLCTIALVYNCDGNLATKLIADSDENNPVIILSDNDLVFFDKDEINYFDYIDVEDDENVEVDIELKDDSYDVGYHEIEIKATDDKGNRSYETLRVTINSYEEYVDELNTYVKDNSDKTNFQYANNDELLEAKGPADIDAFTLAQSFIGMRGSCVTVAQAFINSYFGEGYDVLDTYDISADEAEPGDIIYYSNSGFGQQHYAVYLGGSSALQGNINGTTKLGYVYMNYGSTPQFKRLTGR